MNWIDSIDILLRLQQVHGLHHDRGPVELEGVPPVTSSFSLLSSLELSETKVYKPSIREARTNGQNQSQNDRSIDRQRNEQIHTQTNMQIDRHVDRRTWRSIDLQIDGHVDRSIDRQTNMQIDRLIDRRTQRQIDRQRDETVDRQMGEKRVRTTTGAFLSSKH